MNFTKIVINSEYGGFELPRELLVSLNTEWVYDDSEAIRTNDILINWVEEHEDETDLEVFEIPSNATDYMINEYDGYENIIYVVDGKIYN